MGSLFYIREHLQCENYLSDDKCMFSKYLLKKEQDINIHFHNQYLFIFMLSGSAKLEYDDETCIAMEASQMYSIGYDQSVRVHALEEALMILLIFDRPQILCDEFNLMKLKEYLTSEDTPTRSLPINEQMSAFLTALQMFLDNKMFCKHLQAAKQSEFFFIMRGFYTKEESAMFLYPIIRAKDSFKLLIKEKACNVETVKELAVACNMTTKTLTRRFKEAFNSTPKQWLLKRKKQNVKIEVIRANNFKELQGKVGFSSYAHLNNYCVRHLNKSLKEIKNEE